MFWYWEEMLQNAEDHLILLQEKRRLFTRYFCSYNVDCTFYGLTENLKLLLFIWWLILASSVWQGWNPVKPLYIADFKFHNFELNVYLLFVFLLFANFEPWKQYSNWIWSNFQCRTLQAHLFFCLWFFCKYHCINQSKNCCFWWFGDSTRQKFLMVAGWQHQRLHPSVLCVCLPHEICEI